MISCRNCGVELDDSSLFCPECGTPVVRITRSEPADDVVLPPSSAKVSLSKESAPVAASPAPSPAKVSLSKESAPVAASPAPSPAKVSLSKKNAPDQADEPRPEPKVAEPVSAKAAAPEEPKSQVPSSKVAKGKRVRIKRTPSKSDSASLQSAEIAPEASSASSPSASASPDASPASSPSASTSSSSPKPESATEASVPTAQPESDTEDKAKADTQAEPAAQSSSPATPPARFTFFSFVRLVIALWLGYIVAEGIGEDFRDFFIELYTLSSFWRIPVLIAVWFSIMHLAVTFIGDVRCASLKKMCRVNTIPFILLINPVMLHIFMCLDHKIWILILVAIFDFVAFAGLDNCQKQNKCYFCHCYAGLLIAWLACALVYWFCWSVFGWSAFWLTEVFLLLLTVGLAVDDEASEPNA